jgi:DNA-binding beta-propeller fold protein YncE
MDLLMNPFVNNGPNAFFILDQTQIASGYSFGLNSAAFVVGPTGLAFDPTSDKLYVASTEDNAIYAISNAQFAFNQKGTGKLIFADQNVLRGPLALGFAPNGDLLTANGDAINPDMSTVNPQNSEIVEFTKTGQFVNEFQIDPNAGGAFGFALENQGDQTLFAAVDDVTNTLDIWLVNQ